MWPGLECGYTQLGLFYHLSTLDVTRMRKDTYQAFLIVHATEKGMGLETRPLGKRI